MRAVHRIIQIQVCYFLHKNSKTQTFLLQEYEKVLIRMQVVVIVRQKCSFTKSRKPHRASAEQWLCTGEVRSAVRKEGFPQRRPATRI